MAEYYPFPFIQELRINKIIAYEHELFQVLVLKGNVNTFNTLARGTPEMVIAEAQQCIRDAGREGFILSTGDQVAGDTPEENFRALIRSVRNE